MTVAPLTYLRMINIDMALGDGKDLSQVLSDPSIMDLTIVAYCMLTKKSKEIVKNIQVEFSGDDQDVIDEINEQMGQDCKSIDPVHKLFYLMCENNVTDGTLNYTEVLKLVSSQIEDSFAQQPIAKKKTLVKRLRLVQ